MRQLKLLIAWVDYHMFTLASNPIFMGLLFNGLIVACVMNFGLAIVLGHSPIVTMVTQALRITIVFGMILVCRLRYYTFSLKNIVVWSLVALMFFGWCVRLVQEPSSWYVALENVCFFGLLFINADDRNDPPRRRKRLKQKLESLKQRLKRQGLGGLAPA